MNEVLAAEVRFLPVVCCPGGDVWGREASPTGAVDTADGLAAVQARAIRQFAHCGFDGVLYLHAGALDGVDLGDWTAALHDRLDRAALAPQRVVLVVPGHDDATDLERLVRAAARWRALGCGLALDDLGTGVADLERWSEIRPDYVRIHQRLVRGADRHAARRDLVRSVIEIAQRMGTRVIVPGISTVREYEALRALGMAYAQGELFAPDAAMPGSGEEPGVAAELAPRATAADLIRSVAPEPPDARVSDVAERFREEPSLRCIALVDGGDRVRGVVHRNTLLSRLAHSYGHALFGGRSAVEFVEHNVISVPSDLPLEALSRRITETVDAEQMFVINDPDGHYLGFGSVFDLLRRITDLQIQNARHANPLTSLPGNVRIEQYIAAQLATGEPFTVVYADLDHFKPYNDHYGYQRGDEVILATARLLQAHTHAREFIGHVGGDDFVLVLGGDDWEQRCQALLEDFAQQLPGHYRPEDRRRGTIEARDRQGNVRRFPLVSLSLSAVPVPPGRFPSHHDIAARLAEVKHCAKREEGNALFVDRRE